MGWANRGKWVVAAAFLGMMLGWALREPDVKRLRQWVKEERFPAHQRYGFMLSQDGSMILNRECEPLRVHLWSGDLVLGRGEVFTSYLPGKVTTLLREEIVSATCEVRFER